VTATMPVMRAAPAIALLLFGVSASSAGSPRQYEDYHDSAIRPLRFPTTSARASEKAPSGNAWCFFAPSDFHHVRRPRKARSGKDKPSCNAGGPRRCWTESAKTHQQRSSCAGQHDWKRKGLTLITPARGSSQEQTSISPIRMAAASSESVSPQHLDELPIGELRECATKFARSGRLVCSAPVVCRADAIVFQCNRIEPRSAVFMALCLS
jgi:hypothetical protein